MYSFSEPINLNQKILFDLKIDFFKMLFMIENVGVYSTSKLKEHNLYKKKIAIADIYSILSYINTVNNNTANVNSKDFIFKKYFKLKDYIEKSGHPELDIEKFKLWLYA